MILRIGERDREWLEEEERGHSPKFQLPFSQSENRKPTQVAYFVRGSAEIIYFSSAPSDISKILKTSYMSEMNKMQDRKPMKDANKNKYIIKSSGARNIFLLMCWRYKVNLSKHHKHFDTLLVCVLCLVCRKNKGQPMS